MCTPIRCATHWLNEIYALVQCVYITYCTGSEKLTRYIHCISAYISYQCVYLINFFEPVQYVIYMHWLSFDLRCESGTHIYIDICKVASNELSYMSRWHVHMANSICYKHIFFLICHINETLLQLDENTRVVPTAMKIWNTLFKYTGSYSYLRQTALKIFT